MKKEWLKKSDKKTALSLSIRRLNLTLGDYLSTIQNLKMSDKEVKNSR